MIDIQEVIKAEEYSFLRDNPHLGNRIFHISLSGSHAYGMNTETSDIDLRGLALNSREEILLGKDFEQVVNEKTDTVIYSLNKFVRMLCQNNPNIVEMLGVRNDMYIDPVHPEIWDELKSMEKDILSKRVAYTFGGYANDQLRRLENKSARDLADKEKEQHIINSIKFADSNFRKQFPDTPEKAFSLYVDKSEKEEKTDEIFIDVNLYHYPLRDFVGYMNGYNAIVRDYDKIGKRNKQAQDRGRLAKHSAHLVRLYFMCFDILGGRGVITYREREHDLLMDIRTGKYLDDRNMPTKEFYEIVNDCEKKLQELKRTTTIRETPNIDKINEWLMEINGKIVKGEL